MAPPVPTADAAGPAATEPPAPEPPAPDRAELDRAAAIAALGHQVDADVESARAALADTSSFVRVSAVGALARLGALTLEAFEAVATDPDPRVRARAAELGIQLEDVRPLLPTLARLLNDPDINVVEAAAWALGEVADDVSGSPALDALIKVATNHEDALARECAIAALGAIGDERALPAILQGCNDKPPVRRRAVLALAPFEGKEVEEALEKAKADRDWQVRQAAEDLVR